MKKIMFNDKYGLTEAVLDGRKTQTRRVITESVFQECRTNAFVEKGFTNAWETRCKELLLLNSKYVVGEVVAVAQSYNDIIQETFDKGGEFKATCGILKSTGLTNKMFVKAELMPHHIRITNVRVERLQDISDEDCLKEGVVRCGTPSCHNDYCTRDCDDCAKSPREAYAILIDKVRGKGTWHENPWVFVYDFVKVD